jgi:hypothetical protein
VVKLRPAVLAGAVAAAGLVTIGARDLYVTRFALVSLAWLLAELVAFRLGDGDLVALAPSVIVVLAHVSRGAFVPFALGTIAVQLAAAPIRSLPRSRGRGAVAAGRTFEALAAFAANDLARHVLPRHPTSWVVARLLLTALAVVIVDLVPRPAPRVRRLLATNGHLAYLALGSTGALMAVGIAGADGRSLRLLGLLFAVPLLASWYSFERIDTIRRTASQTIRALSIVPERAGATAVGHAERVAALAVAVGREVGLQSDDLESLERAALLDHLGVVCLDDLPDGHLHASDAVRRVTARMLRETGHLGVAADILAGVTTDEGVRLAGQALRLASEVDGAADGIAARVPGAVEDIVSTPGRGYDLRLLAALERVVLIERRDDPERVQARREVMRDARHVAVVD